MEVSRKAKMIRCLGKVPSESQHTKREAGMAVYASGVALLQGRIFLETLFAF